MNRVGKIMREEQIKWAWRIYLEDIHALDCWLDMEHIVPRIAEIYNTSRSLVKKVFYKSYFEDKEFKELVDGREY